jgi:hypothetical protein
VAAPLEISKAFLALNPTQYRGIPHAFRAGCGCDEPEYEEEI